MDMVTIRFHCQKRQALLLATFGHESFRFNLHFSGQNAPTVLGNPYEVIGD
jgi:hypothetical protein